MKLDRFEAWREDRGVTSTAVQHALAGIILDEQQRKTFVRVDRGMGTSVLVDHIDEFLASEAPDPRYDPRQVALSNMLIVRHQAFSTTAIRNRANVLGFHHATLGYRPELLVLEGVITAHEMTRLTDDDVVERMIIDWSMRIGALGRFLMIDSQYDPERMSGFWQSILDLRNDPS